MHPLIPAAITTRTISRSIFLHPIPHPSSSTLFKALKKQYYGNASSSSSDDLLIFTCTNLISHCSNAKHLLQTHAFMLARSLDSDNLLLSKFISAASALGFSDYAYSVFLHSLPRRPHTHTHTHTHIYLYNTIIYSLSCHQRSAREAVILYLRARESDLRPDTYTFPFLLKAIVRLCDVELGRQIHCQAIGVGFCGERHLAVSLVQMYSSCGCVSDARKLFDETSARYLALWNAMLAGYAKVGLLDNARDLLEHMHEKNVISWTAVIAGYAQLNRPSEAILVFRNMQLQGVQPDEITMLVALSACAQLGALELGEWIHIYINGHGLNKTLSLSNALIDMYAKSGHIMKAKEVFDSMKHKSVITWTTMIAGLALHGLAREALDMFSHMGRAQINPNEVTFIAVLSACSHAGLVDVGCWCFKSMALKYGIQPQIEHYGCIIDLLGRAGFLREAQDLVRMMPFGVNAAIWGSLLTASKIHGDIELGERALQHLARLEPHHSGNYSLLSNVYAAHGWWNEAGMMRKVMRDGGVKKIDGGSCIEVSNSLHEFKSGDLSHPPSDNMKEILALIVEQSKMAGNLKSDSCELLESAFSQNGLV